MRSAWIACLVALTLGSGCFRAVMASLPANRRAAESVDRFAKAFWGDVDDRALDALMADRLKLLMRPAQLRGIKNGLIKDQGEVRNVGAAWYEDSVVSYRRFRVPVEFERTTVDMRIVVDESDRVSQLFIVDHIPPP
jgi:hypothetical protein